MEPVPSITTASRGHRDDIDSRFNKYLVSMAIRTLCFVVAYFTPSPWMWFFVVGAVFLPYLAMLLANAGRERPMRASGSIDSPYTESRPGLASAPEEPAYGTTKG